MPIRNPFSRRPGINVTPAEPWSDGNGSRNGVQTPPAFEKVDTMGSRTSGMSIDSSRSQDTGEYKMSVVNDSGVYLPPSPTEKTGFWPRRTEHSKTSSTNGRNSLSLGENEPFSISRESFDSYRRSFDISARSPIVHCEPGRQSLDSARLPRFPRASLGQRPLETADEKFEDVGLNDDQHNQQNPKPRKKGFFSKFGDGESDTPSGNASTTPTTGSRFHIPGRKRGQSIGQGAELGAWKQPETTMTKEVEEIH